MTLLSIGDLAQDFALRRQTATLTREMARLTGEVSTGQTTDVARQLGGQLGPLAEIERALTLTEAQSGAARLAAVDAALMQGALERVQDEAQTLAARALSVGAGAGAAPPALLATEARAALHAMIGALNGASAGRALFAGDRSDAAPLAPAETLLADLRMALGGRSDIAAIDAALDDFFDAPGGGFETAIYRGGTGHVAEVALGAGESVALRIRADDPALRAQLRTTALAALVDDAALALDRADRQALAETLGERLLAGQDGVTGLRARLVPAAGRRRDLACRRVRSLRGHRRGASAACDPKGGGAGGYAQ